MGEVVERPLCKCISEGLMHVAAWYHGTPVGNEFLLANAAKCSCAPTKKCVRYPLWKYFAPQKSRPKFTIGH